MIKMVNFKLGNEMRKVNMIPAWCSGGYGFDSCWGTQVFSLSHTCAILISSLFTMLFIVQDYYLILTGLGLGHTEVNSVCINNKPVN